MAKWNIAVWKKNDGWGWTALSDTGRYLQTWGPLEYDHEALMDAIKYCQLDDVQTTHREESGQHVYTFDN